MKLKLGDYVRHNNEYWYLKDSHSQYFAMVNIKTFQQKNINIRVDNIKKVSELELSILKYRNIIPKRDLIKGDKFKFVIDKDRECIHGNNLRAMGFNINNIYTVDNILNHYGKCISIIGYNFSMLEVRLVGE